jgi:hypothetical protein
MGLAYSKRQVRQSIGYGIKDSLISISRASTTWPNRTKFWAYHPWCLPKTSLVLLVRKVNTTGHPSKPNKTFLSKAAYTFFIWTFLDL